MYEEQFAVMRSDLEEAGDRYLKKTIEMQDAKLVFDAALRQNTAGWRRDCQELQVRLDKLAHRVEFQIGDVVQSPVHGLCTLTGKFAGHWNATIDISGETVVVHLPFDTFTHSFVS